MIEDYKKKSRALTKFIKTSTIEEIAERLRTNEDDRLLAAFILKRTRDPESMKNAKTKTGPTIFDVKGVKIDGK